MHWPRWHGVNSISFITVLLLRVNYYCNANLIEYNMHEVDVLTNMLKIQCIRPHYMKAL